MTIDEALAVAEQLRPLPGWTQTKANEAIQAMAVEVEQLRGDLTVAQEKLADVKSVAAGMENDHAFSMLPWILRLKLILDGGGQYAK